jgi:hypothetical protein
MNTPQHPSDHPVDALVRDYLAAQAARVDAAAMLARVKSDTGTPNAEGQERTAPAVGVRRFPFRVPRSVFRLFAVAATLLLAFAGGWYFGEKPAHAHVSAESLVREARQVHALPLDRCYLVQSVPEPDGVLSRYPQVAQPRETRLWTRGDRFWIESTNPEKHWAWGRDQLGGGRLWLSLGGTRGVWFDREELDDSDGLFHAVNASCEMFSMRVETLLTEVLSDFDLKRETTEAVGAVATHRIRADLKPGATSPRLRAAVLEIDAETRVLRRLVLHRTRRGEPLATVTFTLVETRTQPDDTYTLEGHLNPDAPVYGRGDDLAQRTALLRKFFRPGKAAE